MKNIRINVLTLTGFYIPGYRGGGPIKTIKNLCEYTGSEIGFKLITSDRDLGDDNPYETVNCGSWNKVGNASVFYVQCGLAGYSQIVRILKEKNYDLVYLNSFFSSQFSFFPVLLAKVLGQRIILGPRGEFSEGALNLKPFKKRVFITLYKLFRLHQGIIFQASSDFEAGDIRRTLGDKVDIRVAENIGAQEFAQTPFSYRDGALHAVFVSRISPMKNLLVALEMLGAVQSPLSYHIYGPIEDQDYWAQCQNVIRTLPAHIHVDYKGMLAPHEVVQTLANYDLFFFPTKGENYGHVIAEALCAGLPILISDTTPWRNLPRAGIGWDLSLNDPSAFSSVLDEVVAMAADEHLQMREKVLSWARNKFSQRDAIEANIEMFRYAYEKK